MTGLFEPIISLTVNSSTPSSIGGYDVMSWRIIGSGFISEGLRTQSLRGMFRWWTRAFLSGAFYDYGLNDDQLYQAVRELSNKIWGSVEATSWLRVNTQVKSIRKVTYLNKYIESHPRLKLLSFGWRNGLPENLFAHTKASVTLERPGWSPVKKEYASLIALVAGASFVLGCFGKGARRGLGCFDIEEIKSPIYGVVNLLRNATMNDGIVNLIKHLVNATKKITQDRYNSSRSPEGLPVLPSVAVGVFRLFECPLNENPFTMSMIFSLCVTRSSSEQSDLWTNKNAWILGLPRSRNQTGYIPLGENITRRGSPISLSIHKEKGYITVFYSKDWPRKILWKSGKKRGGSRLIEVDENKIKETTDEAVEDLLSCLGSNGVSCSEVKVF